MNYFRREDKDEPVHGFVSPYVQLNAGLWTLWAGATALLGLRVWVKLTQRHGLWYDDHILIVSWALLLSTNALLVHQYATGYVLEDSTQEWDDRMHILINISSCGMLMGQAWTKTAFGVTLLRISNTWQRWVLWFCIVTMNLYMIVKVVFQWAKVCDKESYHNWYRLDFCIYWKFRDDFKEGGNIYNVIMDFVFASFPWLIARRLEMRRVEKIGLCATMSLGMIVAIQTAVRIAWKDNGNERDEYYFWRNAMSQIWYTSEIAGTIMVQCIPVLRPILRDIHNFSTNKKLTSSTEARSSAWMSKRASGNVNDIEAQVNRGGDKNGDKVELTNIPEEASEDSTDHSGHSSTDHLPTSAQSNASYSNFSRPRGESWVLTRFGGRQGTSMDIEHDGASHSSFGLEVEHQGEQGLSPPPRKTVR